MTPLVDFVLMHTERGECQCGWCIDKGNQPDPTGHTVDTGFFKVVMIGHPSREEFEQLVRQHRGEFRELEMLDEGIHSYIEVGAWIGDQGIAMQCMALGRLLGCWKIVARPGLGCFTIPNNTKQYTDT